MNTDEVWKPVLGFEGIYEVSSHGRVRSLDRILVKPHAKHGYPRKVRGCVLKQSLAGAGYHTVSLSDHAGRQRPHYVAHLVAAAFIGARPEGQFVCHNDGDKSNNHRGNLRYDTRAGNEADKVAHGTVNGGERCNFSKLSAEDVRQIRILAGSMKQKDIAARFGITQPNVSMILSRSTWETAA